MLVLEDQDPDEQDLVYYVGPNILALEKLYAFPPREFRLWIGPDSSSGLEGSFVL